MSEIKKHGGQLDLNPAPDGYGFIYGTYVDGDDFYRINIMPPAHQWAGDIKLDGYEPHDTDYVLYVDGEEVGRVRQIDQLTADVVQPMLVKESQPKTDDKRSVEVAVQAVETLERVVAIIPKPIDVGDNPPAFGIESRLRAHFLGLAATGQDIQEDWNAAAEKLRLAEKDLGNALSQVLVASISERTDGEGGFYGQFMRNGESVHISVYPPRALWNGVTEIPDYLNLSDTHWQLYLGGELHSQAAQIQDFEPLQNRVVIDAQSDQSSANEVMNAVAVFLLEVGSDAETVDHVREQMMSTNTFEDLCLIAEKVTHNGVTVINRSGE